MSISAVKADITQLPVDAIVNAANNTLLGGGGVDGAIHRAAGPELLNACQLLNGCLTGQAKITDGFNLSARFIIHTVGPIWQGGTQNEAAQLQSCYQQSLDLASQYQLNSIAFPAISCGVYGYPIDQACLLAYQAVKDHLASMPNINQVVFCCVDDIIYDHYQRLLGDDYAS